MSDRIVALIDMDCFYCQVEARLNPILKGKPVAVVQYNTWKGGGIIAVNYEAKELGVTRHMRGEDAKKICPTLELVSVPEIRGKADLSKYRDAGREVATVLSKFSKLVEKASIDEAYIDLTTVVQEEFSNRPLTRTVDKLQSTFVVGYERSTAGTQKWLEDVYNDENNGVLKNLVHAAELVEGIRETVLSETGFHCSAGISYNKILAKLACGLHKPNRQTVLTPLGVPVLYETLPLKKVRNLGGKFGCSVEEQLNCKTMGELSHFTLKELQQKFDDKAGLWLYNIAKGVDSEPVKPRMLSQSIGCCKKFPGRAALKTKQEVEKWLKELANEVSNRLQEDLIMNKRKGSLLTVCAHQEIGEKTLNSFSRSTPLKSYKLDTIVKSCYSLLLRMNTAPIESLLWCPPLKLLGLSVSRFVNVNSSVSYFNDFFASSKSKGCNLPQNESRADDANIKITEDTLSENTDLVNINSSFFYQYFKERILDASKENFTPETNADSLKTTVVNLITICESTNTAVQSDKEKQSSDIASRIRISRQSSVVDALSERCNIVSFDSKQHMKESCNTQQFEIQINDSQRDFNSEESEASNPISEEYELQPLKISNSLECIGVNNTRQTALRSLSAHQHHSSELCPECNKLICISEFLEHLDYHAAIQLHHKINTTDYRDSAANLPTKSPEKLEKRQSKITRKQLDCGKKNPKITTFFKSK